MNRFQRRMHLQISMFEQLGYKVKSQDMILDFGCGSSGELVKEYRKHSFQALGCSFHLHEHPDVLSMTESGVLRLIHKNPYKVPFDDNTFDVIISDQVFEHVEAYPSVLSEISRLLKPGGISLHIFVSRYRPIEAHTSVPFGSIIQKHWWYYMWEYLRIKKVTDKSLSRRDLASRNYSYVRDQTNYLTKSQIRDQFSKYFENTKFCEDVFLKHHHRVRFIYSLFHRLPFLPLLFSTFHSRVIFFSKPCH